ncbi:hypothetical protein OSB04_un000073 [Centaurea solstitialis]|uniref:Reverse transcriptase zinc-binding domain-containing protein n=1 Tax=Centaurea solstitialis TaxID=347529 RepID=A0AA38S6Z6_9ASTR|nr:hypothetical protein OSB04_un000073 [Centaurea solstitialis]
MFGGGIGFGEGSQGEESLENWKRNVWRWNWVWRREPRGRELEELEELKVTLGNRGPSRGGKEGSVWSLDAGVGFSVKEVRRLIDGKRTPNGAATMWVKAIPKKVSVFLWRAKLGRLPVREELDKRGIDLHSLLCPCCGDEVETIDHALFGCTKLTVLWKLIERWWKTDLSGCSSIEDLLGQGFHRGSSGKVFKRWVALVGSFLYFIWSNRNKTTFGHLSGPIEDEFYRFQLQSFEWISRRDTEIALDWKMWLSDPSSG